MSDIVLNVTPFASSSCLGVSCSGFASDNYFSEFSLWSVGEIVWLWSYDVWKLSPLPKYNIFFLWNLDLPSENPYELKVSSRTCFMETLCPFVLKYLSLSAPGIPDYKQSLNLTCFYSSTIRNSFCLVAEDVSSEAHFLGSDCSSAPC